MGHKGKRARELTRAQARRAQRKRAAAERIAKEQAAEEAKSAAPPGGQGDAVTAQPQVLVDPANPPPISRSERVLEAMAIRQRFPMLEQLKRVAVARLFKTLNDPDSKHRDANSAARTVGAYEALQMEEEKRAGGGEKLEVNVQGQVHVTQRTELDINVRIDQYLAEYDALAQAAALDAGPPLVSVNGENGVAQSVDQPAANHKTNGFHGPA